MDGTVPYLQISNILLGTPKKNCQRIMYPLQDIQISNILLGVISWKDGSCDRGNHEGGEFRTRLVASLKRCSFKIMM